MSHINRSFILGFLDYLERERQVSIRTRNHRLAAIQTFFRYLLGVEPDLERHCRRILSIPVKRFRQSVIDFLDDDELQGVFDAVTPDRPTGHRDLALLMFAYNTGARVHEIARARRDRIVQSGNGTASIRLLGKGKKEREVPLWDTTVRLLGEYAGQHRVKPRTPAHAAFLFLGCRGEGLTRFQVGRIITRYIRHATEHKSSMQQKRLTAHSMRHTTAVHLLQSGAELNTIKAWLGHASVESLKVYLDLDLAAKRHVLESLEPPRIPHLEDLPRNDPPFLDWLDSL